tara:strand:- start:713 stop:1141 length:429 start_codon:yes stop_codon:yes gene_type:complete
MSKIEEKKSHWLDSIDFPNLYWIKGKGKNKVYTINSYPTKSYMVNVREFLSNNTYVIPLNNLISVNKLFTKDDGESFELRDVLKDLEENKNEIYWQLNSNFKEYHYKDYYTKLYPFLKEKYDLFLKEEVQEIGETIKQKENE